jgi:site-specific DNA-cytosine methylase
VLGAKHVGAPHHRERIWIFAHTSGVGLEGGVHDGNGEAPDEDEERRQASRGIMSSCWEGSEAISMVLGMDDGMANRDVLTETDNWKQRIEAVGNGQVPACAALAWRTLMQRSLLNQSNNGQK